FARQQIRQTLAFLGFHQAQAPARDRFRRGAPARVRAQARSRPDQSLWFRQLCRQPEGSLLVDLDLVPRGQQVGGEENHLDSGRTGGGRRSSASAQGLQSGSPAGHRHRSVDGRSLSLRRLLGYRRPAAIRRLGSAQPEAHRKGTHRRDSVAREPPRRQERQAQWWTADGGGQPRRPARLFYQLALWRDRSAVLSGGYRRLDGEAQRQSRRRNSVRSEILHRLAEGPPAASSPPAGRRLFVGFVLLSVK